MSDSAQPVALVTGAGSGIGEACAVMLARCGYGVAVADLNGGGAARVADAIKADGGSALALAVDVTDVDAVEATVSEILGRWGRLDAAVNNAGIGTGRAKVADVDLDEWHRTMGVNLHGMLHCLRAELRVMRARGGGSIVNMGSVMSVLGTEQAAAYSASKHAILGLTRSAALDHAADGIRVNVVGPGFVHTPLFDTTLTQAQREAVTSQHPRGQVAEPDDVAALVAFLLSDDARNITGAFYANDGGYTVH